MSMGKAITEPKKRARKPTISERQLRAAKAAGATSYVIEENGCRVEVRFDDPEKPRGNEVDGWLNARAPKGH
jgi:hypothetical protein